MAIIKPSHNMLRQTLKRAFSNKATLNLESKLAREELVLVVDEEDNPVRQATRLEVVNSNIRTN
jgi:hypothetical protein